MSLQPSLQPQQTAPRTDDRPRTQTGAVSGLTARVLALALLLVGGLCWWITYTEVRTIMTELSGTALPIAVLFALFVICALNSLIARRWPQRALRPSELAALYILVAVGASAAGIGMIGFLAPAVAAPVWFSNQGWEPFAQAAPGWWSPRDPEAVRAFYLGNSTLYTAAHLRAWLPPVLTWGGFLLLLMLMTLCMAAILRRQWIEHERLNFPITYVPMAMIYTPGGFGGLIRSRALLFGLAVPVVLQSINNLNWLFPSVPLIPLKPSLNGPLDLGRWITSPPWNAIGYFPLAFHPNCIGLSYLLSTDVSFSCWFFHLLRKGLEVWSVARGYSEPGAVFSGRMPFTAEQGAGAWVCLALLTVWAARRHLTSVLRGALHPQEAEDAQEGMSYRTAVFGVAACFVGLVAFGWWGGLPLGASVLLFGVFAAYMLALTRIRAEVGTPWHFPPWVIAPEMVVRMFGPMHLNTAALGALAYHTWYNWDYRSMTTPHFFEGYRIAEQGRLPLRKLTLAMILALILGLICAAWTVLHMYYIYGAGTAHVNPWRIAVGKVGYTMAVGHLAERNVGTDTSGLMGMGAGAFITLLLSLARARFVGWPFHPAGYAVANTFITDLLWCPFFLGWLAKWLTLKWGGMNAYRRALPFFIGLILGDYIIVSLWTLVGLALGVDTYRCFPN